MENFTLDYNKKESHLMAGTYWIFHGNELKLGPRESRHHIPPSHICQQIKEDSGITIIPMIVARDVMLHKAYHDVLNHRSIPEIVYCLFDHFQYGKKSYLSLLSCKNTNKKENLSAILQNFISSARQATGGFSDRKGLLHLRAGESINLQKHFGHMTPSQFFAFAIEDMWNGPYFLRETHQWQSYLDFKEVIQEMDRTNPNFQPESYSLFAA